MKTRKEGIDTIAYGNGENSIKNYHSTLNGTEHVISIQPIIDLLKMKVQLLHFSLAIFITFISPLNSFAQLPNMGTSIKFAVFTSAGVLSNTGTSTITGDIGTNIGDIIGFGAPTVVIGSIDSGNAVTIQCAIDVQAAYNELFSTSPTVLGHAPTFGNGEILPVGVYSIGVAGSVVGDLTLDAAGDPDAIFIFQFGGALSIGDSTTLNLINGASACNVFWIAEGAISLGTITDMKGSLISNNGAVSMGAGGILEGRLFSTGGAASVSDALITIPPCIIIPLPINMLSFTGHCDQQNIVLQWITATEINNDYFTIERSQDGFNWHIIGTVTGAGYSSSPIHYSLTDISNNTEKTYYQLKQTDFDGNDKYETPICINTCDNNRADHFTIYPNPSEGKFELLYTGNTSTINSIDIFNSTGQKIYSSTDFQSSFDFTNSVPGFYYINIQQNSETTWLKYIRSN